MGRRADIMKFKDFESSIKELLETEIYFADLEEIWDYWEQPEYLILADFDRILKNNRGRR